MSLHVPIRGLLAYFDFCRRLRPELKDNLFKKKYSLDDNIKGVDNPKLKFHPAFVVLSKCPEDLTLIFCLNQRS